MPESAEVRIVVDNLKPYIQGHKIVKIGIVEGSNFIKRTKDFFGFQEKLPLTCKQINTIGKKIFWTFSNDLSNYYMINSLGMTGNWVLDKTMKHNHFYFETEEGERVYYNDPRKFGFINFTNQELQIRKEVMKLGIDILSTKVQKDDINSVLLLFRKYSKQNICTAMMSQEVLAGVGNYIKAEALYKAKISPWHIIQDLSDSQLLNIFNQCHLIAIEAYRRGGNSFHTYKHMDGASGTYSDQLVVYKKQVDQYNNIIIKEETPDNRNTYWCPTVQK